MEWFIVISLIIVGLILLVVEVIFIPGTTIAGFIGFGLMVLGVFLSFNYFDDRTGWAVTVSTSIVSAGVFIWVFRAKPWRQFALQDTMGNKVNEGILAGFKIGDEGAAISRLRPRGNAEFSNRTIEVSTEGNYVEAGTPIKIIRILSNQIIVEPLN